MGEVGEPYFGTGPLRVWRCGGESLSSDDTAQGTGMYSSPAQLSLLSRKSPNAEPVGL